MMKKHNFKIGDKVKLVNPLQWSVDKGGIGVITGLDSYIRVKWGKSALGDGCIGTGYPHIPDELKHVIRKGEQLLFSFMTP